ncbi:MAG: hybrid sensor histidine kinase/response regulator [Prochlorotrichaceae cyanobacterium]
MWIEDDELREIFKTASEERLQAIDEGLLQLEQNPDNPDLITAILREAHSMKGDSNMLGVKEIGTISHEMEHILKQVQQKEREIDGELCDRLSHTLTAIRKMVHEAVTGEPCGVTSFHVLAELMGAVPAETPETQAPSLTDSGIVELTHNVTLLNPLPDHTVNITSSEPSTEPSSESSSEPGNTIVPPEPIAPPAAVTPPEPPVATTSTMPPAPTAEQQSQSTAPPPPPPAARTTTVVKPADEAKTPPPAPIAPPKATHPEVEPITVSDDSNQHYKIETIRVPTQNLDVLMTQAGELTVTKIRIAHRLTEIEGITNLWEEWNRDFFINRFLFDESQGKKDNARLLQAFYNRSESQLQLLGSFANQLRSALYEDITRLEMISNELEEGVRILRLLPLSTMFNIFPRMVRDLARQEGKQVELLIEGGETRADKRILEEMKDPIMHMIRNAIDHGIESPKKRRDQGKPETATIKLRGYQTPSSIVIEVEDDGQGLDIDGIKETALRRGVIRPDEMESLTESQIHALILRPGFSTRSMVTEISGRGVGLDVLRTNVERLKGTIEIESVRYQGCTIRVALGTTLATAHVLIVAVRGRNYALPVEYVETACLVDPHEIFTLESRQTILHNEQPVSVVPLAQLLELSVDTNTVPRHHKVSRLSCIILKSGPDRLGIFVDALVDEQDVVLKPQSQLLKRIRNVSGATILGTGDVCMVLNPQDLIQSIRCKAGSGSHSVQGHAEEAKSQRRYSVLLVEDSIATRTQEKRILEAAGFEVVTAVDGLDGFNKLQTRNFDAVVSDVQMPNLDGLGLTERIRQHREYSELPVVLVTTLATDEDKRRGAEVGANAYITKGSFTQDVLLDTLQRLI